MFSINVSVFSDLLNLSLRIDTFSSNSFWFILLVIVLPQVIENITVLVNNVPLMIEQSKVYLKIILDNLSLSEDMVASIEGFQNVFWTGIVSSVSKYAPSLMTGV